MIKHMKIQLDNDKFDLYTQAHKNEIGEDLAACLSGLISGLTIVIPNLNAIVVNSSLTFEHVILTIIGLFPMSYGIYKIEK